MPAIKLASHSSSQIYGAVISLVSAQGFSFNKDLSGTEKGRKNKEFFVLFGNVVHQDNKSNNQNLKVRANIDVILLHNAQKNETETMNRILDDVENIVFAIERFSPESGFAGIKAKVEVTNLVSWETTPLKSGDDTKLRTVIQFEIQYKITNPIGG